MNGKIAWLMYRKLRPALGIPFAFVIMSGVFLGVFSHTILVMAVGFLFIDLFGNFYNDYWDYPEDKRNKRLDKLTTCGFISVRTAFWLSWLFASIGLLFLLFTDVLFFMLGALYAFILFLYSHESVRLKGSVAGYNIVAFPFFLLPLLMAYVNGISLAAGIPLALFFFLQYSYILCQKDSTDRKDKTNLFIAKGWKKSVMITAAFAAGASLALLLVSSTPLLLAAWMLNASAKACNIYSIGRGTITRPLRSNLMLLEFAAPYMFAAGLFL
jgi:4-hydroxybenzoate polyprenyltransferase